MVAVEGGCGEGSLRFGIAIEGSKLMGITNTRQGNLERSMVCSLHRWKMESAKMGTLQGVQVWAKKQSSAQGLTTRSLGWR